MTELSEAERLELVRIAGKVLAEEELTDEEDDTFNELFARLPVEEDEDGGASE